MNIKSFILGMLAYHFLIARKDTSQAAQNAVSAQASSALQKVDQTIRSVLG